jgi:hypothetical protein
MRWSGGLYIETEPRVLLEIVMAFFHFGPWCEGVWECPAAFTQDVIGESGW